MQNMAAVTPTLLESQSGNEVTERFQNGRRVVHKRYAREAAFQREKYILQRMADIEIIAPEIIEEGIELGHPTLTLSWVEGCGFTQLSRSSIERAAFQAGLAIAKFNRLAMPVDAATPMSIRASDIEETIKRIEPHIDGFRDAAEVVSFVNEPRKFLNHRDIRFANLLWIEERGEVAVLDYETSCWGPKGADLGRMVLDDFADEGLAANVIQGYQEGAGELPDIRAACLLYAVEMVDYLTRIGSKDASSDALQMRLVNYIRNNAGGKQA